MSNARKLRNEPRHESELAELVLGYLAEHPDASDTLEGIAGWWITRQIARVEVPKVAKVLRHLAASNLLERIEKGNNPRYRLKIRQHESPC